MHEAELLDWDSTFWGVTIGRVTGNVLDDDRRAELDDWARVNDVACLYFLASSDDPDTLRVAQAAGYALVDIRVELSQPSTGAEPTTMVRAYRPADLAELRAIARTRHENTRFYADGHFPRQRCADLYDTWIVRSCEEGWADDVLVAELGGRAVGYVTLRFEPEAHRGSIGLIAVSAAAESDGVGGELVAAALAWCRERDAESVSVVTQGSNVVAQRLFQRMGFRTTSTGLWFHRWYQR